MKLHRLQRSIFDALYVDGAPFLVHVRAATPDVELPLAEDAEGLVPIRLEPGNSANHQHLVIGAGGFRCTVARHGAPHSIYVPWDAIAAMVQGEAFAVVWEPPPPEAQELPRPRLQLVE